MGYFNVYYNGSRLFVWWDEIRLLVEMRLNDRFKLLLGEMKLDTMWNEIKFS